jgi:hypothetical protein
LDKSLKDKFLQLQKEVQAAGGTTAELLGPPLDENSDEYRIVNEMDSHLSIFEDQLEQILWYNFGINPKD